MLKFTAFVLLLIGAVFSDGFLFPDQVSSKANSESWHGDGGGRGNLNSYGDSLTDHRNHQPFDYDNSHRPAFTEHFNGNEGGFVPGFGNHHGHHNRGNRQNRPYHGGIVSQSEANAQSTGFGSQANSQSGSQSFNGVSQSNAQSQAQSQGYQAYPFGPSGGGSGASSASSAASATSGIVDGVASASAAAAAASAASGGGSSVSSSASSSSSSGNNGGFGNGNPPWFYRSRIAGEDGGSDAGIDNGGSAATNDKLIFSEK